jgi:hypothetical protein
MRGGSPALHGTGIASEGKVRIDLDKAEFTPDKLAPGDFLLASTSSPVYVARKSSKKVEPLTASFHDQLLSMATNFGIADISAPRVQSLGAGESIEGRATQRYRITGGYGMKGEGMTASVSVDVWTVKLPEKVVNPFLNFGTVAPDGASAKFEKPLGEAFRKIEGFPVKAIVTTGVTAQGLLFELVQTTAITDLKQGKVDVAKLVMPPQGFSAQ